jgi:hypothetical protein
MNTTYFPILKAKDAEFDALRKVSPAVTNSIVPLFEVPRFKPGLKKYKDNPHAKAAFLSEISRKIGELRSGMYTMFDTFHWQNPGETVETGEHHLYYLYRTLKSEGVNVIPVIGYDRWDDEEYRMALRSISKVHTGTFCIRFEKFAFEDAGDPIHFNQRVKEILNSLGINPIRCHVILDLEDISVSSIVEVFSNFELIFPQLLAYNFASYSVAGCSLPNSIDKALAKDSCGPVKRKEKLLWKNVRNQYPAAKIYFGDYGIRGPSTGETGYGNTNAKIRYTIEDEFYVVRGHVIRKPVGGFQHCELAKALINSGYYLEPEFSWGDNEIQRCANGEIGGGSTTWITIDTNHHVAYVVAEIAEFERMLVARAATIKTSEAQSGTLKST